MYKVDYHGGESRYQAGKAVDYMLCNIGGVELYAEADAGEDENANYADLKEEIISQAIEKGVDLTAIFFCYD